jgi:hypothetical protein
MPGGMSRRMKPGLRHFLQLAAGPKLGLRLSFVQ